MQICINNKIESKPQNAYQMIGYLWRQMKGQLALAMINTMDLLNEQGRGEIRQNFQRINQQNHQPKYI